MKCSDFIAKYFQDQDIKYVFDYAGGMITNLEDSISSLKKIQCMPTRHEQGAGFAAEGYARASENFGVAMATSGPGATNLMTAIGSCYFDSVPTFFITGQVNTKELRKNKKIRQNGFQELDVMEISSGITKYSKLVLNPANILYEIEKAHFYMLEGRPGPVLLDIPINIQYSIIDPSKLKRFIGSSEHKKILKRKSKLQAKINIQKLIKDSKNPIVLFGGGVKNSETKDQLHQFLINNNLPSVSSLLGLGQITSSNKNYIGFIGSYGNRVANIILANADLIFVLGSRLDIRQTGNPDLFAKKAKIVHVDIDEYSVKKNFKNYTFLNYDLKYFFDSAKKAKSKPKKDWLTFIKKIKNEFHDENVISKKSVDPNNFFEKFSFKAPNNSVVVADVGQNQMWLAQSWMAKKGQKLLFNGGMGSMGFSLPASIGAYCATKSDNVFSFMGDGGLQMNIQELETIRSNNLPIKIIVLNNYSLGMVRDFQDEYFDKRYQSTVIGYSCPDIKKISNAYGIKYMIINNGEGIDKKIDKIIKSKEAVIIEIIVDRYLKLKPKVVYGESIENQSPFLSDTKRNRLEELKEKYLK